MQRKQIKLNINDSGNIFDPDELKLTRSMIKDWIKQIRKGSNNASLKMFCATTETLITVTPEDQVVGFWKEVLGKINELLMMNALEVAKGNNEAWADTVQKLMKKESDKND